MKLFGKYKVDMIDIVSLAGVILTGLLIYYGYKGGLFESRESLIAYVNSFGFYSVLIFILIQVFQVVLPFLPAAVTCTAGIVLFGAGWGLFYNYLGISLGSIIAFLISRRYGQWIAKKMVGERLYQKYAAYLNKGKAFDRFFAISIIAPIAPDDALCYLAGLTSMSLKKFTLIILLGKPLPTALYSLGSAAIFNWLNIF